MSEYGNFIRRADLIKNLIDREKLAEEKKKPNRSIQESNRQRQIQHQELLRHEIAAQIASANSVGGPVPPSLYFANSEKGVWFDASDISTMFQDTAGTIPVTTVSQSVAKWIDKSGNGAHATQATGTKCPTYQVDQYGYSYLDFDGVDDFMITPSINFTSTAQMQASVGVLTHNSASAATAGIVVELGINVNTVPGSFHVTAPSNTADHSFGLNGSAVLSARVPNIVAGDDILTGIFDISQTTKELEIIPRLAQLTADPTTIVWTGTNAGTGNFANLPIYIGSRAGTSTFFKGHMYQIVVRGATPTATQLGQIERWINSKID